VKWAARILRDLCSLIGLSGRVNASVTQEALIQKLNPVIRGWAMYHRHVVAKASFLSIDSHIWQRLWKWAKRRHPTKGARWVRNRYFRVDGHRSWDFATKGPADGSTSGFRLFRAMTIPITRHVKVRGLPQSPARLRREIAAHLDVLPGWARRALSR
jgi:RNA-directed DNA polymerase